MTIDQFLKAFERKRKRMGSKFRLNRGRIRTRSKLQHCPLSYVAGTKPCVMEESRRKLKLSYKLVSAIVGAADNPISTPLRRKLLRAAGL